MSEMTNLERAVKDLQDNLVVISELERRQSERPPSPPKSN